MRKAPLLPSFRLAGFPTGAAGPLSRHRHHLKCRHGSRDRRGQVEGEEVEDTEGEEEGEVMVVVEAAMEADMAGQDTEEVAAMGVAMEVVVMEEEEEEGMEVVGDTEVAGVMEEEDMEVVGGMAEVVGGEEIGCRGADGTGDLHMQITERGRMRGFILFF